MAIMIKTPQEIEKMRISGKALRQVHDAIAPHVVPGASTMDLEQIAVKKIAELGAIAAFKGYHGYPAALCTSVNDEVVHGIPSAKRRLKDGDIIGLDLGCIVDGYYGDCAVTLPVGPVSARVQELLDVTRESLDKAIVQCRPGNRIGDISYAVQAHCESHGFGVVRAFVGHGIGRSLHEDPQVPNFGKPKRGPRLVPGLTIAIEPMVNAGVGATRTLSDNWTVVTRDGKRSAHFEHTVAITAEGPRVLTAV